MRRITVNRDALTAKTVADELFARADSIAKKAKAHPDWRSEDELSPHTQEYTASGHAYINRVREDDEWHPDALIDNKTPYENIMSDMKPLSSPFTAFRILINYRPDWRNKESFIAKEFWSTTVDLHRFSEALAKKATALLFIMIPKGVPAIMVQGSHQESEIILPPGTKFKIKHKRVNYRDKLKYEGPVKEIRGINLYGLRFEGDIYVMYVKN